MKNYTFFTMSSQTKIVSILVIVLLSFSGFNKSNTNDKITICHMPPGNIDNCHEITISRNALQTHLDHGDKIFCDIESDYDGHLKLVNYDQERIIKRY